MRAVRRRRARCSCRLCTITAGRSGTTGYVACSREGHVDVAATSPVRRKVCRVWPPRPGRLAAGGAALALAAASTVLVDTGSPVAAGKALIAGAVAAATLGLAVTLPRITARGPGIGGLLPRAGIL